MSAFYHYDRSYYTSNREFDADPIAYQSGGGSLTQARLNSSRGTHLTSELSVVVQQQGQQLGKDVLEANLASGPQVVVHNDIFISSGIPVGTGLLVQMNNPQSTPIQPSSFVTLQGEVTYFKEGWGGSHEFKSGVWAAPRSHFDVTQRYVNGGFVLEEVRQIDPSNPAAGVTPFHRRYNSPSEIATQSARDKDIGIFVQDSWKPHARMTASVGVRVRLHPPLRRDPRHPAHEEH